MRTTFKHHSEEEFLLWEKTAIDCVTDGCERLHTEMFRSLSIEAILQRCEQFFNKHEITTRFFGSFGFFISDPHSSAGSNVFWHRRRDNIFHLALAPGFALISFAVFDFKITRWTTWIGCVSTSAFAAIFLLQGVSELIQNDSQTYLAFQVLGQRKVLYLLPFVWFLFESKKKISLEVARGL